MSGSKPKVKSFKLPDEIFGSTDVRRVQRELEDVDNFFHQAKLRSPGSFMAPPKTTASLNALFEVNQANILSRHSRSNIIDILNQLDEQPAAIHISFPSEPAPSFLKQIVVWSRQNLHPYLLVNTGIQPSLLIGCYVRTNNKVFDMSLRNRFKQSKPILINSIHAAVAKKAGDGDG